MKPYRSLSWLEWGFGVAVLWGLLSCGVLMLIHQFQQEASERIVWWNEQISNDEERRMYQGWITNVEHQQQQAAFIQTISCWGWRGSIAIAVFCWLSVLTLNPRRALQMLAFMPLWIRFRWAARVIRRWRREEPQRIGYFQLASAILLIAGIIGIYYISLFDTFRLWKILEFCSYIAFVFL